EKQAYLSYAHTRYRWGKLVDSEPSRFLEEIDDQYLEYITPKAPEPRANRFIDVDLFDDAPKKIRFQKPIQRKRKEFLAKKEKQVVIPPKGKMKKISDVKSQSNLFDSEITVGNIVEHNRFGIGEVLNIEGKGANKKAQIKFQTVGNKNLLLQFAKLKIVG
ncbi:MAG: ATP-dependent DNA helicase, partial [Polaribacter sp.]